MEQNTKGRNQLGILTTFRRENEQKIHARQRVVTAELETHKRMAITSKRTCQ